MKLTPTCEEREALNGAEWDWKQSEEKGMIHAEREIDGEVVASVDFEPGQLKFEVLHNERRMFDLDAYATLEDLIYMDGGDLIDAAHELRAWHDLYIAFETVERKLGAS